MQILNSSNTLRVFTKFVTVFTLFLIFVGALVKSTDSGLAVPDWPLSYGTLFPPMVGGVFYEHGHRMVASFVGLLTVILSILLKIKERRRWVYILGFVALFTVILQGLLGGLTVLLFLPTPISVFHGVLAQTFLILTIIIAYSQSKERAYRQTQVKQNYNATFLKFSLLFSACIYIQLILGAVMRHTESGLAIPDFPTMGGFIIPSFNEIMLHRINVWRFENNLNPVIMSQVIIHFIHRAWALGVLVFSTILWKKAFVIYSQNKPVKNCISLLNLFVWIQVILGILTVLTIKEPFLTSCHVVLGAGILGLSVLLILRSCPLEFREFKKKLFSSL